MVMSISPIDQNNSAYHLQALSPAAQEEKEKKAIANDPRVKELLNGNEITEVYKMPVTCDDNKVEYIVYTDSDYFIRVYVIYAQNKTIGPVKFILSVNDPELKNEHPTGFIDNGIRNPLPIPISVQQLIAY